MTKTIYCKKGRCYCNYIGECKGCKYEIAQNRILDDWIKPFIDSINERFKNVDNK